MVSTQGLRLPVTYTVPNSIRLPRTERRKQATQPKQHRRGWFRNRAQGAGCRRDESSNAPLKFAHGHLANIAHTAKVLNDLRVDLGRLLSASWIVVNATQVIEPTADRSTTAGLLSAIFCDSSGSPQVEQLVRPLLTAEDEFSLVETKSAFGALPPNISLSKETERQERLIVFDRSAQVMPLVQKDRAVLLQG